MTQDMLPLTAITVGDVLSWRFGEALFSFFFFLNF